MTGGANPEDIIQMKGTADLLRGKSLYEIYKEDYMQYLVGQRIEGLMGAEPEKQYPEARGMKRHFILHIGPTNSGKTYQALQRLKQAYHGIYLGPLRLLALEVYDRMMTAGIPCNMITGEETIRTPGSFVQASTVEILDIREIYDIAVIDEAQMMADENRGSFWTRAILGIRAEEIHVCCSGTAQELLVKMISRCGDSYEIVYHERNTKLEFIPKRYDMSKDVEPGDALIAFSKKCAGNRGYAGRQRNQSERDLWQSAAPDKTGTGKTFYGGSQSGSGGDGCHRHGNQSADKAGGFHEYHEVRRHR